MPRIRVPFWALSLFIFCAGSFAEKLSLPKTEELKAEDKLLYQYRFFYLPFDLTFENTRNKEGKDQIVSFRHENPVSPEVFGKLEGAWETIRSSYEKRSLFLATPVAADTSVTISKALRSHSRTLRKDPFEILPLGERMQFETLLAEKPEPVRKAFGQLRLIKSLFGPGDDSRTHFIILSPDWCRSSREYRVLFETYFKEFPHENLVLHSVLFQDPQEIIFDSAGLRAFLPFPEKYSHESLPAFLMYENVDGRPKVYSEGEALKALYDRYFKEHKGFLENAKPAPARTLSSPQN